jgi:plastocyanin
VVAREFSMIPSRLSLAAGTVSVELNNRGEDPHDLRVERADSPGTGFDFALAKPSTVSSRKLDLAPGKWKLYCTLPGHDEAGMHAFVTVTP